MSYELKDLEHYFQLLRSFQYDYDSRSSIQFGYDFTKNPNLLKLKQEYALEEVAGHGDEFDRLCKLRSWVHNAIKYDGSSGHQPASRNALYILSHPESKTAGVNCRMMAIVLNEVYLSLGWKSRYVRCIPADTNDRDSHVVTVVYYTTMDKWVMMDPSLNTHLMDVNGTPLNLQETRDLLAEGHLPVVNQSIGINPGSASPMKGVETTYDELSSWYQMYMAKNLFRMESPILSQFNYESEPKDIMFSSLQPANYEDVRPAVEQRNNGFTQITVVTSNPKHFWDAP